MAGLGRKTQRALVAHLALEEGGIPLAKTARFFGKDGSTLVRAVERLRGEE